MKALVEARTTTLPHCLIKRIALHLLRGIAHVHELVTVHTDLKRDNIFFSIAMTADDIAAWVTKDPSHDGMVQAAILQPLPHDF